MMPELAQAPIANEESYRIHNTSDIQSILHGIMQANTLITLYFGQENDFILTSILAVDPINKRMILDYGNNEKTNQRILNTAKLTCVTSQAKIKVEFTCGGIKKTSFKGNYAFIVNLPESLVRVQRRDFFRIATPTVNPLKCIIPLSQKSKSDTVEVVLLDISCGGMAVLDQNPSISLEPKSTFSNCLIELPEVGEVTVNIRVKNNYQVALQNEVTCQRAGCVFIKPPTRTLAMIQRYIVKLEQIGR